MMQEARPWLVDFHVAAAFDSFPVFWALLLGLLLVFYASWDLSFLLGLFLVFSASCGLHLSPWVALGVSEILMSGFGVSLV